MSTYTAEEPGRVDDIITHCKWQVMLTVVTRPMALLTQGHPCFVLRTLIYYKALASEVLLLI